MSGKRIRDQGLCPAGCGERLSHNRPGNPHKTFKKHGCPHAGKKKAERPRPRPRRIPEVHDNYLAQAFRRELSAW